MCRAKPREEHAFIFASHLVMLADPWLHDVLARALRSGLTATEAVRSAFGQMADRLAEATDPYPAVLCG